MNKTILKKSLEKRSDKFSIRPWQSPHIWGYGSYRLSAQNNVMYDHHSDVLTSCIHRHWSALVPMPLVTVERRKMFLNYCPFFNEFFCSDKTLRATMCPLSQAGHTWAVVWKCMHSSLSAHPPISHLCHSWSKQWTYYPVICRTQPVTCCGTGNSFDY